jgi:spectinomycin phosphotransferase
MRERPDIAVELIKKVIKVEYKLFLTDVLFLPIGYDINTAVYHGKTADGDGYFIKLRKGLFNPVLVEMPELLHRSGIQTVIAPIETSKGKLFAKCGGYILILYPYISGKDRYEVNLTERHWRLLGWTLKQIHSTKIPAQIASLIPRESYDPQWRENVRFFQQQVEENSFEDPVACKLAIFLKFHRQKITLMVDRAEQLASDLKKQTFELVLCHSDAHPGNFFIAENGDFYLVDWDTLIIAPRERDLMFFGSGMAGDQPGSQKENSFYLGYGPVDINLHALAYYRYERIIQDIAEFCKQLLLSNAGGADREEAYKYLCESFLPGQVVEVAVETDRLISPGS